VGKWIYLHEAIVCIFCALAEIRFPFLVFPIALQRCNVTSLRNAAMAGWQSGHAAACKAVDAGSIPTPASSIHAVLSGSTVISAVPYSKYTAINRTLF
jgi:hypothetical protein